MNTAAREAGFAAGCAAVGAGVATVIYGTTSAGDATGWAFGLIPVVALYAYRLAAWARR